MHDCLSLSRALLVGISRKHSDIIQRQAQDFTEAEIMASAGKLLWAALAGFVATLAQIVLGQITQLTLGTHHAHQIGLK